MDESEPEETPGSFESLVDAASILLLGSQLDPGTTETCFRLLGRSPLSETRVVHVTYHRSPNWMVREWDGVVGERPAAFFVVTVDGDERNPPAGSADVTHRQARATDLTGLGIEIQRVLDEAGDGGVTRVCFDSLTALLMYVDERVAFRFVRTVAGYVVGAGATFHLHLDPDAHDSRTVGVFSSVVDAVVETDESGEVRIRSR